MKTGQWLVSGVGYGRIFDGNGEPATYRVHHRGGADVQLTNQGGASPHVQRLSAGASADIRSDEIDVSIIDPGNNAFAIGSYERID